MAFATIDLITEAPDTGEFGLVLVEDGPWPKQDSAWEECLTRIQNRIYDAIDIAVDGHLAAKYPDSEGKNVRVQIDSPSGLPPALSTLVFKIREYLTQDNEYHSAIENSPYIKGLRVITGYEMGRFA